MMEKITRQKAIRWLALAIPVTVLIWLLVDIRSVRIFGFGILLIILWLLVFSWLVWSKRTGNLIRRWNRWLGAILITIALIGLPVLFAAQGLVFRGVSFDEITLGGFAGQYIVGDLAYAGFSTVWRPVVLIIAGAIIIFPGRTWCLLKSVIDRFGKQSRDDTLPQAEEMKITSPVYRRLDSQLPEEFKNKTAKVKIEVKEAAAEREVVRKKEGKPSSKPIELLSVATEVKLDKSVQEGNEKRAQLIEQALASYGVEARVIQINPGPIVTQFGVEPGWDRKYKKMVERDLDGKIKRDRNGNPIEYFEETSKTRVKVDRITSLANDLAMALAVPSLRIEAPVPGKPVVGVEVPNDIKTIVSLRSSIESDAFVKLKSKSKLAIALGQGAGGEVVVGDLTQMPHLLIAGSTGSGKTVCLGSIIACFLVNATPADVRMLLIDPKRVELVVFNSVPHLIMPVVVDLEETIGALRRVMWEMDNRYRRFAAASVNNITNYNKKISPGEQMPYLVVVIDELADLMSVSADLVEPAICRIAQLSRATGIHIIIATQRPSVDVITGLIKANFPTRISFSVPSQIDSRTILDSAGAEKLLGGGDMLYLPIGTEKPKRLRGAFVSEQEMYRLVQFWKYNRGASTDEVAEAFARLEPEEEQEGDSLLDDARRLAIEHKRISTSFLQRRLHIGYPRAARIIDALEEEGVVSSSEPGKLRQVLDQDDS